jgi:hypothetical protein
MIELVGLLVFFWFFILFVGACFAFIFLFFSGGFLDTELLVFFLSVQIISRLWLAYGYNCSGIYHFTTLKFCASTFHCISKISNK